MIARATLELPFPVDIPAIRFDHHNWRDGKYTVSINLGVMFEGAQQLHPDDLAIKANGQLCRRARSLIVDIQADDFDRRINRGEAPQDPAIELIFRAANGFLNKFRVISGGYFVKQIEPGSVSWEVAYLNDD